MHFGGGADMDDIMQMMMGGGMGGMGGGQRRKRKGRDVGMAYPVTLEDLYNGKKATLPREKTILCPDCDGTGAKKGSGGGPCRDCRGQGARMAMKQVGPGMVQQMQVPCDACSGSGMKVADKDKCKSCNMRRTKTVDAPLKVTIEKGMEHEQQIPFMNEGDQSPEIDIPGHIVVVLQEEKHKVFTRQGDDLKMTQKISLAEALCGFQFTITHMDGRQLLIENQPGEQIKPGDKKAIIGEGMPKHKKPTQFGDLIIEFEVEFPSTLDEDSVEKLRKVLPAPPKMEVDYDPEEAYPCSVQPQAKDDVEKEMKKQAAEDDDDDEEGGAGGVQCAQS